MKRARSALALAALAVGLQAPAAHADIASSIQADLVDPASNVPGAQVTVGAPTGDALLIGSGQAVSVTLTPPIGAALTGIIPPPGAVPLYTTTNGQIPVWDLAIMEAVKHSIAAGNSFDSLSITRNYAGVAPAGIADLILAAPPYQAPPAAGTTMSLDEVRQAVVQALPRWAQSANVGVMEDAASERVVTITLALPNEAFTVIRPDELLDVLEREQRALQPQGAKIGRVIAQISSRTTNNPLYTGVGDSYLGFSENWTSPLVQGLLGELPSPNDVTGTASGELQALQDQAAVP
jgi:hypothetical protein